MARRVFFSFHYESDAWRAAQVRNSWLTQPDRQQAGFWDAAAWEKVKRQGEISVKNWIDGQLNGTSVTAVLIGQDTASRPYVQYEIQQSQKRGNGILGIFIDRCKDQYGYMTVRGLNPLTQQTAMFNGQVRPLSTVYPTYDWVSDSGRTFLAQWIEQAARAAGR